MLAINSLSEAFFTNQSTPDEHDSNGEVLKILSTPCRAPSRQMFQEYIGRAVSEDEEALDELC